MEKQYYMVNSPKVVDEIFEDEVIVINFDNGDYFSLRQSAVDIWKDIKKGYSLDLILEKLQTQYETDSTEIQNLFSKLIDDFLKEGLISLGSEEAEIISLEIEASTAKKSFEPPVFEKYTDMNDLLLLDPVHDVDEKGWPYTNIEEQNG